MKRIFLLFGVFTLLTSFAPKKEMTWCAIGDSITWLDGRYDQSGDRLTKGYESRVTEKLPNIHFTNHGHSGWTTKSMAAAIEKEGLEKADIYSVYFGTNDWWGGLQPGALSDYQNATGTGTMYGAYRVIINKIRSLNPNAHIILISPMQRGDFVYVKKATNNAYGSYKEKNGHTLSQFADIVKTIAETEKFDLADLYNKSGITPKNAVKYKHLKNPETGEYKNYKYPDYTTIPFDPEMDEYPYPVDAIDMTYDGLHPSDKGMAVIADMLVKVMKKY